MTFRLCLCLGRFVDPNFGRQRWRCRGLANEALRVGAVGSVEDALAMSQDGGCVAKVDVGRPLRANIGETLQSTVITEQGENGKLT